MDLEHAKVLGSETPCSYANAAARRSESGGSPVLAGHLRMVPTRANRQPAVAAYVRGLDDPAHRVFEIAVRRIEDGRIVEVTAFHDLACSTCG